MITSSKHAQNRTKQDFWGLDKFQQRDACYKTDGVKRDSFWETPTIFHHHPSTALRGVGYQSLPNFLLVSSHLPPLHSKFWPQQLLQRDALFHRSFWPHCAGGGAANLRFSQAAQGKKTAATANVKINKWSGNPFSWCRVHPRHPII